MKLADMSCQWRPRSAGSWEMTQSNPPSELPSDPITSGSSNPDERSCSPETQSEKSRSFRAVSEAQVGDSLFSQAALQETEPIPRDVHSPIIIPDTESDTNNHTTMGSSKPKSKTPRSKKKADAMGSDQDDDDEYKESDGGEHDSDSSYVEGTSQSRNKKKAPSKSTRRKPVSKPQPATQGNIQNVSKVTKGPKHATQTSQLPKKDAVTKTASKLPQKADKKPSQQDEVIPDSQPVDAKIRAKPVLPIVRVPKKTFYTQLEDGVSTRNTQAANTKPQAALNPGPISRRKKNPKNQGHVAPKHPEGVDDDDSIWNLPGSPEKQNHNPLPKIQSKKRTSPNESGEAIGPNSKKKRSPVQSGSKQGNVKKSTTRAHRQKGTHSGDDGYSREQKIHKAQYHAQSMSTEINQLMDQSTVSSNEDDLVLGSPMDDSAHIEEQDDEATNHSQVLPSIPEEQVLEAMTTNQAPERSENMTSMAPIERGPPNRLEDDAQVVLEERLEPTAAASKNANKQTKEAVTQTILVHKTSDNRKETSQNRVVQSKTTSGVLRNNQTTGLSNQTVQDVAYKPETVKKNKVEGNARPVEHIHSSPPSYPQASFSRRHGYMDDGWKIAEDADQSKKGPVSVEKQEFHPKETENFRRSYATPIGVEPRLNITDLGSPLMLPEAAVTGVATLGSNPLQPISHGEQPRLPSRSHVPFNYDIPFPLQMTSDFEKRLLQAKDHPLANRSTYQAPEFKRPVTLNHSENYQPRSRAVLSPSSSVKRPTKDTDNIAPQIPQPDPKSIDFARRAVQSYKHMIRSQADEGIQGRDKHIPAKQPLWMQSRSAIEDRDASKSLPSKADNSEVFFGGRLLRRHEQKQDKQAAKPEYEMKWQNAVDAASGGVVDTLHLISTSLLEHLRTREQSVIAVIEEYKRNGMNISERLAKRQRGELHQVSVAAEQKCLELAKVYGDLSKKTRDFRTKCLPKHRSQAYVEWQRQAARIKNAVRAAREEETLG
ncbi:hypothetical protein F5B19DRAFT_463281 [Rostrohypoxylon terebratum]|nr:hypothetical protein F5B19DRAFT_463281 [Rostrohypoxylon terebratum]